MKNWIFIVAGLAALAVTLLRTFAGGATDLAPLLSALEGNSLSGVVLINWHALNVILGVLSLSLLGASRMSRASQMVIGVISALSFGAVWLIFMTVTAIETGSPFTFPPFIPLGVTTFLCAAAAWSVRK